MIPWFELIQYLSKCTRFYQLLVLVIVACRTIYRQRFIFRNSFHKTEGAERPFFFFFSLIVHRSDYKEICAASGIMSVVLETIPINFLNRAQTFCEVLFTYFSLEFEEMSHLKPVCCKEANADNF